MDWKIFLITLSPYILAIVPGIWIVAGILRLTPLSRELRRRIESHLPLSGWIGVLERLLVIYLVGCGEWSALGFIVAAKGLLRLPDIRRDAQSESDSVYVLSSYVLLGTLISLALAIVLAELSQYLRCQIVGNP